MTGRGWLFDLYPCRLGMRLWFLQEDGGPLSLWDPYAPTFYVRASRSLVDRALRSLPLKPIPLAIRPTERLDFWTGQMVPVVEVQVRQPLAYASVVSALGQWQDGALELFTCDIPLPQRYGYDRGVFPLAFCTWEATDRGQLLSLQVSDDPWAVDYRLPSLTVLHLSLEGDLVNPRHGHQGRLEVSWDGRTRLLDGEDPVVLLETLARLLEQVDPDVILTHWGDAWLLPRLTSLARRHRVPLPWHRDPEAAPRGRRAQSYFSYGRIVRREAAHLLAGRWHLDHQNTFLLTETGLEGLMEVARLSRIPVQRAARISTGTAISSLQLLQAHHDGVLIPWHKQRAEDFKTADELLTADKGGLVFVPEPGVYGDVAELDFASLYPAIMATYNISPETLDCPCCPHHRVPEIGRHTCTRRHGLVPRVLAPILEKRARLKVLKQTAVTPEARDRYDRQQTALKWLLVTSFGYLGYKNFIFGRIEAHESVTAYSREILLQAKEVAEADGYRLIHAIVDAIWIHKPGLTADAVHALAGTITQATGLPIAVEGLYRWLIVPPSRTRPRLAVPNRFFGLFQDGSMKVRGLECRRRDTPPFIRDAQQALLAVLAKAQEPAALPAVLDEALETLRASAAALLTGRVPLQALAITKQVSQDPDAYRRPGDTAIVAQSLLARGIRVAPGEAVQYVITSAGDPDPASRVRPVTFGLPDHGYDRETYLEWLLRAADTVLGCLGYDVAKVKAQL
jgi:DNA polymerase-2